MRDDIAAAHDHSAGAPAVDLQAATATVEYEADVVKPEALASAVRALGYEVPA